MPPESLRDLVFMDWFGENWCLNLTVGELQLKYLKQYGTI
jgi:hypothetical protein